MLRGRIFYVERETQKAGVAWHPGRKSADAGSISGGIAAFDTAGGKGRPLRGRAFPAVAALCALSALAGGVLSVRLTGWPAGGVLSAAAVLAVLALAGLGIWEEVAGRGGVLLLCGLAGGLLAGGPVRKKRRRRK